MDPAELFSLSPRRCDRSRVLPVTQSNCSLALLLVAFVHGCFCASGFGIGISDHSGMPRFLSRPSTFQVVTGDTVVLPCEVQNLGTFVVIWRRSTTILSAGQLLVTRDPRFTLTGHSLRLTGVRAEDQGDYTCQIGDGTPGDLIHSVQILVPPTLNISPMGGQATARKGGTVTFECMASGNPIPSVQWARKDGGTLPIEAQGPGTGQRALNINEVQRHNAGIYQCTASNGIGHIVSGEVRLHVLYPPEVRALKSWVNTGEGLDAKLQCSVKSDPVANVQWFLNSFALEPTDRRTMHSDSTGTYTLQIRSVRLDDFGNYSCLVMNSLGRERRYIELSGKPGPAIIISRGKSPPHVYNLTWSVQSVFEIPEARLVYRRVLVNISYQHAGIWHDTVIVPETSKYDPSTGDKTQWYVLKNLAPDSVYECLLQVKNRHGWGELSEVHQWFTAKEGEDVTLGLTNSAFNPFPTFPSLLICFLLLR